jgi:hypothetical protein
MELSKHKNHRDASYLSWLRKQECVISGQKAQCAHHIRLGTNGGSSLKPSDYFCIPLLNEYHTTGLFAIHIIGEDSFLTQFRLNKNELFIGYLKQYLIEEFDTYIQLEDLHGESLIAYMIKLIEEKGPQFDKPRKKTKNKKISNSSISKKSITENEFYQTAKEEKKVRDRQLRMKLKEEGQNSNKTFNPILKKKSSKSSKTFKGNEFYEKAKEDKRIQDKELRQKLKASQKTVKTNDTQSEFYEKAKELKRMRDKELREKIKLSKKAKKLSNSQTEFYLQGKEQKRIRDKELRQKVKEQRKSI